MPDHRVGQPDASEPEAASVDVWEPKRPAQYGTDLDWAAALQERVWELEDELAAAMDCLESNERNIKAWREEGRA